MKIEEACSILKINENFDEKTLKKAYKKEIMKVHPDINPNLPNAKELSQRINEAYDVLKKYLKYGKSVNFDNKKYEQDKTIDFIKYKQSVLDEINRMIDQIIIDKNFKDELFFMIYKKYLLRELEYYKNFYDNIINKSNNEKDLLLFTSIHQYEQEKLMKKFIEQLFKMFKRKCNNFSNKTWLEDRCNKYIMNSNFNPKTINECMQYYINAKTSIVKRVMDKQIDIFMSRLSWTNKKYLKDNTKIEVMNKLLLKFSPEEILSNEKIIRREFNNYIMKRRIEYIKFFVEKNYKIINLNFWALKSNIKLDKKQLKRLKLERREDRFNDKYILIRDEFFELLNLNTNKKYR